MKSKFLILVLFFIAVFAGAQSKTEIGKIQLSVYFNEFENLNSENQKKIENKINLLLTQNGFAAEGYNNGLIIEPHLVINSNEVLEGGIQNLNVVNATFSLFMKQANGGVIFSSFAKEIKGVGKNKDLAISNIINNISNKDNAFDVFFENGKKKIIQYYNQNCENIIAKADALSKSQSYEESLALLMSVPESVTCYKNVQSKAFAIFKKYQQFLCSQELINAKGFVAQSDYSSAIDSILKIDPESSCFKDGQLLIKSIENKISAENRRIWTSQMKIYDDGVALEKMRINAIKDIAVSYYKGQKRTVNNQLIIVK